MKDEILREKQLIFLSKFDQAWMTNIHDLLRDFYRHYPANGLIGLKPADYVYGRRHLDHKPTFCYWMEKTLSTFGRIAGSRVPKFPDLADIDPQFLLYQRHTDRELVTITEQAKQTSKMKVDPLKKSLRDKAIGDRGEQIIKLVEQQRLIKAGHPELAAKVDWVSEREDGHGYDILSWEADRRPRHIEVKATSTRQGDARFFLTSNELALSKDLENYYIYYVHDVTSKIPRNGHYLSLSSTTSRDRS
jgi:hypothetical protein